MGLRDILNGLRMLGQMSQREEAQTQPSFDPQQVISLYGSTNLQLAGQYRPAEHVVMVYGCLVARREAVAGVPIRISDAADNIIESGPVVDLLARPNQSMPWDQFIRRLETYQTLYDANVVAIVDDGAPELIPLHPLHVRPQMGVHAPTGTAIVVSYDYHDPQTGRMVTYSPDQVIVRFGFNPHAALAPLSPLSVLNRTIQGELAAREQNLALFKNDAAPKGVITTTQQLTKEQSADVIRKWNDAHKGIQNRGKMGILTHGATVTPLGLSPAEMEYINGLRFLRTDYYMVFRVCPAMVHEMISETGLSQGSSTDDQKVNWWENVGLAELDLMSGIIEEAISKLPRLAGRAGSPTLRQATRMDTWAMNRTRRRRAASGASVGRNSGLFFWFDDNTIPALVKHRLAKLDQLVKVTNLGWAPDDAADWLDLGMPPHPDNLPRVPFSLQVIGPNAEPIYSAPTSPAAPLDNQDEEADEPRSLRGLRDLEAMLREQHAARPNTQLIDAVRQTYARVAARRYSRMWLEQRDRILKRLGGDLPRGRSSRADEDAMASALFPRREEDAALWARIGPTVTETMQAGWNLLSQETGVQVPSFQIDDPNIARAIEARRIQAAKVNDTTEEVLRTIIQQSFADGWSTAEMGDRIAAYFNENCVGEKLARPQVAAMAQTNGIVNESRMMAAKEVGGLRKGWLHGNSDQPRPGHISAQERYLNQPIDIDQPFVLQGADGQTYECQQPGDSSLPAGEVCGCTCTAVFFKGAK